MDDSRGGAGYDASAYSAYYYPYAYYGQGQVEAAKGKFQAKDAAGIFIVLLGTVVLSLYLADVLQF